MPGPNDRLWKTLAGKGMLDATAYASSRAVLWIALEIPPSMDKLLRCPTHLPASLSLGFPLASALAQKASIRSLADLSDAPHEAIRASRARRTTSTTSPSR